MILEGILSTFERAQGKLMYPPVKEAYKNAIRLLEAKLQGDEGAVNTLKSFLVASETVREDLEDYLLDHGVYQDNEILDAVEKLRQTIQDARHQAPDMPHVFLSYSRTDYDLMERVANTLSEGGIRVWTDDYLSPGTPSWKKAIQQSIETSGAIVVLLSPGAKASEWVEAELDYGKAHSKGIFPILARGDEKTAVPFGVNIAQRVDIRDEGNYTAEMNKLIAAIRQYLKSVADN